MTECESLPAHLYAGADLSPSTDLITHQIGAPYVFCNMTTCRPYMGGRTNGLLISVQFQS